MLLAFGRLICLRRRSSVSLSGALGFLGLVAGLLDFLNGFLGWLARRSLFVTVTPQFYPIGIRSEKSESM
jgi:hypothetical protein